MLQALLDRANAERDETRAACEFQIRLRDEARAVFNRYARRVAQDMELEEEWGLLLELKAIPWATFEATGNE